MQTAVRQVAYGTLSRHDRKAVHLAVASGLEAREDTAGEVASIAAQHYLEALDAVPDAPDAAVLAAAAVRHLERAAARAGALGAPEEAAGHLQVALDRCSDAARAAAIEAELAEQLQRAGDHEAAIVHAGRARDAFDAMGDPVGAAGAVATLSMALAWGRAEFVESLALARERADALADRDDALGVRLRLAQAIVSALLRSGSDMRDAAEEQARLADRVGDDSDVADSYISLALHYMVRGPHRLGRVLLESAAAIARGTRDTRLLVRALTNLNADATQEDAERAVETGREAVDAGRAIGDRFWISSALCNLLLAELARGEWDDAMSRLEEVVLEDPDVPYADLVRSIVLSARGQRWEPLPGFDREAFDEDRGLQASRRTAQARAALDTGDPGTAVRLSLEATRLAYAMSGIFDDFTVVWQAASDVAWEAGDRAALDELFAIVDRDGDNRRPTGLRAVQARMRGLCAGLDGDKPASVEQHFRSSIDDARAWKSPVAEARARADLAVWLTQQGRGAEAGELLAAARATFDRLGAVRWAEQLDGALAGVPA